AVRRRNKYRPGRGYTVVKVTSQTSPWHFLQLAVWGRLVVDSCQVPVARGLQRKSLPGNHFAAPNFWRRSVETVHSLPGRLRKCPADELVRGSQRVTRFVE